MSDAKKKQGIGRGNHPNSKKNLELGMWEKGQSGNPAGKIEGTRDRKTVLKKWTDLTVKFANRTRQGAKIFEELGEDITITVEDEIDLALIREARKGNVYAIREIKDTLYGKLADKTEHSGSIDTAATLVIQGVSGSENNDNNGNGSGNPSTG